MLGRLWNPFEHIVQFDITIFGAVLVVGIFWEVAALAYYFCISSLLVGKTVGLVLSTLFGLVSAFGTVFGCWDFGFGCTC